MPLTLLQVLHQGGGAGSVTSTLHLSIGLQRAGINVRFMCPPDSEVEAEAGAAGLEVHALALARGRRLANAAALERWLSQHPVDLINSQSARDREALTWLVLTRRLSVPFVITRRQMPRTFWVENWVAGRLAARVIAVSCAVGEALVRRGTPRRKLAVIHNGLVTERVDQPVSPADVEAWRGKIGWQPSRPTIGIVSRLKDQGLVLEALGRVNRPVRLVLAGVDRVGALAAAAAAVPDRHAVVFVPFTSRIRPLYELLDLVLLPSHQEGLSQALLEAMALGKPVAASAATGNLEVITDGVDGRLVPPFGIAAWATTIEELLADPARASLLGRAARTTAREKFSLQRTVQRTAQLYHDIIEEREFRWRDRSTWRM